MANCCDCDFEVEFETKEEKESFIKNLKEDIEKKGDKWSNVVFFGSNTRYLFDVYIFNNENQEENVALFQGWV